MTTMQRAQKSNWDRGERSKLRAAYANSTTIQRHNKSSSHRTHVWILLHCVCNPIQYHNIVYHIFQLFDAGARNAEQNNNSDNGNGNEREKMVNCDEVSTIYRSFVLRASRLGGPFGNLCSYAVRSSIFPLYSFSNNFPHTPFAINHYKFNNTPDPTP